MQHGRLPGGVTKQRTTDTFDAETVPPGLLRAHRVAAGVWGLVQVVGGELTFVWEDDGGSRVGLGPGDALVIPPEVRHHVELGDGARFHVSFYR